MSTTANHTSQRANFDALTQSAKGEEWLEQLKLIVDRLQQIYNLPLVAHDIVAQNIFRDLAWAPDMDEIARQCDLLIARINELLTEPASSSYIEDISADPSGSASRVLLTL